jgi:inorganic pyrophosphatase
MTDRKGLDEKILAVPVDDPRYSQVTTLADLSLHWQREIAAFFRTYKELEGEQTDVRDWLDVAEAWHVIEACRQRYERLERGG